MALSPLMLILALMVFGWLWGIVGLLLAVPLLVCVKLVLARDRGHGRLGAAAGVSGPERTGRACLPSSQRTLGSHLDLVPMSFRRKKRQPQMDPGVRWDDDTGFRAVPCPR